MTEESKKRWRKSSYSADASNCVIVGQEPSGALSVIDSKSYVENSLLINSADWRNLLDHIKEARPINTAGT